MFATKVLWKQLFIDPLQLFITRIYTQRLPVDKAFWPWQELLARHKEWQDRGVFYLL